MRLAGDARRQRRERMVRAAFRSDAVLSIVISAAIVASLVGNAFGFLLFTLSANAIAIWLRNRYDTSG